jgi:hypothetical protein
VSAHREWCAPQHVDNCNCDFDCDDRGYFECSTDPRCRQLRDEQMGWTCRDCGGSLSVSCKCHE